MPTKQIKYNISLIDTLAIVITAKPKYVSSQNHQISYSYCLRLITKEITTKSSAYIIHLCFKMFIILNKNIIECNILANLKIGNS